MDWLLIFDWCVGVDLFQTFDTYFHKALHRAYKVWSKRYLAHQAYISDRLYREYFDIGLVAAIWIIHNMKEHFHYPFEMKDNV